MAQAEAQVERLGRLESGMNNDGGEGREAGAGPPPSTSGGAGPTPVRPGDGLLEPADTIPLLAKTAIQPGGSIHAPESLRSLNLIPGPKEYQTLRAAPRQADQPSSLRPEDGVPWPVTWLVEALERKTSEIESRIKRS